MKKNQHGFSLSVVLVVILVLGVIGFAGWYLYEQNKTSDATGSTIAQPQGAKQEGKADAALTNEDKYLVIGQWGVKVKLDSNTQNATYSFESPDQTNFLTLSTPELDKISATYENCKGANKSIAIARAKVGDDHFGSPFTENDLVGRGGVKIGDYYYYSDAGQPCFGTEEDLYNLKDVMNEVGAIRVNLSKLQPTIQKI